MFYMKLFFFTSFVLKLVYCQQTPAPPTAFNNKEYFQTGFSSDGIPQDQGRCQEKGGILARFDSLEELNFAVNYLKNYGSDSSPYCYTFAAQVQGMEIHWFYGPKVITHRRWGAKQPNYTSVTGKQCVFMGNCGHNFNDFEWHIFDCSVDHGILCTRPKNTTTIATAATDEKNTTTTSTLSKSPSTDIIVVAVSTVLVFVIGLLVGLYYRYAKKGKQERTKNGKRPKRKPTVTSFNALDANSEVLLEQSAAASPNMLGNTNVHV